MEDAVQDALFDKKKAKAGSFQALGLHQNLLSGLNRMQYKVPTPVQRKALPVVLAGMDVVCMARTGSGKTCVFLLPLVERLRSHEGNGGVRGLVLAPTRELVTQTFKFAKDMAKFTDLRIISIVGGDGIEAQFEQLATRPDIIVATPGRLMHHLREISTFHLKYVKYLVFDEADRLFEMGFAEQLNEIVRECPAERQTLLFSATMPKQLIQFSRAGLRDPQLIRLDTDSKMSEELRLGFLTVRSNEKIAAFLYLVRMVIPDDQLTIVFTATRHHSELLHALLTRISVTSTLVYGTMDQDQRSANLKSFRNGEVSYLIVTDLAARGIDVPLLNNVINFHFPTAPKLFVHRCGRAARQGRIGFALSLVEPEELPYMMDIHRFLGKDMDCLYVPPAANSTDDAAGADDVSGTSLTAYKRPSDNLRSYTLDTMTPTDIHTGIFPQDVLDEENDFVKRALKDDDDLSMMLKISENGMKQYKRTRTEATKEGLKLAKEAVKKNLVRVIHPLIVGSDPKRCNPLAVEKADFIRSLQKFRPQQTIFETGIGTGGYNGNSREVKDPTGVSVHGYKASKAVLSGTEMMKELRKANTYALERNKVNRPTALQPSDIEAARADKAAAEARNIGRKVIDSDDESASDSKDDNEDDDDDDDESEESNEEEEDDEYLGGSDSDEVEDERESEEQHDTHLQRKEVRAAVGGAAVRARGDRKAKSAVSVEEPARVKRLSVAERKKLKKQGLSAADIHAFKLEKFNKEQDEAGEGCYSMSVGVSASSSSSSSSAAAASSAARGFKEKGYMSYGTEDEHRSYVEDAMQPMSDLRSSEQSGVQMLESAMLDVAPDDAMSLNKKRRILRWDEKKRKFVKQSLEEMSTSQAKGNKRIRSESGVVSSKSSKPAVSCDVQYMVVFIQVNSLGNTDFRPSVYPTQSIFIVSVDVVLIF